MKIYERQPDKVLRVAIKSEGLPTEHLTITESNLHDFTLFIRTLVKLNEKPHGVSTMIVVREAEGGKNGESRTIRFKGVTPESMKAIIIKEIGAM